MNNINKTLVVMISVMTALFIVLMVMAIKADAGTNSLPKNVGKFQDGEVTCYTYYKSISCLKGVVPVPTKAGSINNS